METLVMLGEILLATLVAAAIVWVVRMGNDDAPPRRRRTLTDRTG
jgi:hypothetical protein